MKQIEREGPLALINAIKNPSPKKPPPQAPTRRERQVIKLIALGYCNKQVGDQLGISIKTAEKHRGNAMKRLNLRNTADITRFAVETGIIKLNIIK